MQKSSGQAKYFQYLQSKGKMKSPEELPGFSEGGAVEDDNGSFAHEEDMDELDINEYGPSFAYGGEVDDQSDPAMPNENHEKDFYHALKMKRLRGMRK